MEPESRIQRTKCTRPEIGHRTVYIQKFPLEVKLLNSQLSYIGCSTMYWNVLPVLFSIRRFDIVFISTLLCDWELLIITVGAYIVSWCSGLHVLIIVSLERLSFCVVVFVSILIPIMCQFPFLFSQVFNFSVILVLKITYSVLGSSNN